MHGLTGGSWKRSSPVTDTTKNDTRETALVIVASRPTAGNCHRASSRPSSSARPAGQQHATGWEMTRRLGLGSSDVIAAAALVLTSLGRESWWRVGSWRGGVDRRQDATPR